MTRRKIDRGCYGVDFKKTENFFKLLANNASSENEKTFWNTLYEEGYDVIG